MNLSRSSYYYRPKSPEDTAEERTLVQRIEEIAEEFPRYGYRKVTAQLHREGLLVNHKKIQRIMRERGLGVKKSRRFVRTTDSNHPYPVYPNLIQKQVATGINQIWVADLTYIRITRAFVYLAVILDLYSRKAIGYALSEEIDTDLSLTALRMAIQKRDAPQGVIHHSDRGVQYAAHEYIDLLRAHQFRISMSRKGNPYDNAAAESFMKTLKTEEVYLWEYQSMEDARRRLSYFIGDVYNQKRLHASLGYRPPVEYEAMSESELLHHPCLMTLS
jgi:transposase InsO family protein